FTSLLWAVGVVALLLSVASPCDDAIQQELFHPKSPHVALKRLPLLGPGIRKSGRATRTLAVAVSNASAMAVVSRFVDPSNATLVATHLCSSLALRSPPTIH